MASENQVNQDQLETGRKIYMEGLLPSGQPVKAFVQNDIALSEEQASCGSCHRKSGMGSSEGQQVVPSIAGRILFNPLQIPTSKPPEAPILRPAYTDQSLRRAITSGLGADGYPLDPNMPRYNLSEQDLDAVVAYLKLLSSEYSPGVDEDVIHFATIVAGDASESAQDAHMAVMNKFLKQKNTET
ncbi:MAG: cytochrome c, partial [Candidatus Sedimenticola sp. 6PFRAG1]